MLSDLLRAFSLLHLFSLAAWVGWPAEELLRCVATTPAKSEVELSQAAESEVKM